MKNKLFVIMNVVMLCVCGFGFVFDSAGAKTAYAQSNERNYFVVFDVDNKNNEIFVRGDSVEDGDQYISGDNKLYEIVSVDGDNMVGYAKFIEDVQMPIYEVSKKTPGEVVFAASQKQVGLYHTHNDESYIPTDGYDSTYGPGGIHDVGAKLKSDLEGLGISCYYSTALHLPHNSGAYTRSHTTASSLLNAHKLDGLFDIHRDSTPAKEYITTVDGKEMSKVRMVVGNGNPNSAENLEFAKSIKAYADKVYPNLIKDIYIGRGNYNQQLTPRSMLFEMGCENIKKDLPLESCGPLSKTIDVVLYGSSGASSNSLNDVSLTSATGKESVITGLADGNSTASLNILWVLLGSIGFYFLVLGIVCIFSKTARYKTKRFFSELFARNS
ncbi:MAG: stage II sporulation protein P [Clostridia bacterium]|nr:stage II sporulation protein P [Clostridia bacterium]